MEARPGDEISVASNTLGVPPRRGVVLESGGGPSLRVLWDDGHESTFVPGSDCTVVADEDGSAPGRRTLGCHIEVKVTEDDDRCEAIATMITGRGTFEAAGVARRNPADPKVPMIGEELAIGRALEGLASQLLGEAGDAIARHEHEPVRLLA